MFLRLATTAATLTALMSTPAMARDNVSIAGSSTVLPFATIVAERLGRNPAFNTPVVESGGSSVGKKGVCDGIGTEFIDIGNASSRMKSGELEYCDANGVKITEIKVGYDGIVFANSKDAAQLEISRSDLGKALTAKVAVNGELVDNPFKTWKDVNPALPNVAIRVYGPPTTSGTRASFAEIINEKAFCKKDDEMKAALKAAGKKAKSCRAMRTDGAYIEAGEQDNLIVQKLQEDSETFGIFGFSYLDQNSDTLQGAKLDGVAPTFEAIADGSYKASRALFMYVKHQHVGVVPGIAEYMTEWTKHWDEDGILADAGMIPMPTAEREEMAARMTALPVLTADALK
ncbi:MULTISPECIES: substrate-binding domain-containing protein [unclassified Marinobacterium]|jgi:phosphate transport system substrate-binding protein|uniref:substrate-binding domain-containing protein n=1 Tax=unclassified Marinobacterium TaxID=2644139 RepID=UPI00156938B9|nr:MULTISPECIES: substrate-binding domain-containing protein [unclassified Marinobacterium]NRP10792.1 Phosphate-binding protein PstS precursor [Marinobacterium sp. xm-g-48]NRP14928.1 Phosphate-binding protein PstS precursor [Marinobacterium sp. xm-a-152]NRP38655.1 Phosphate-binding protein PstS precursor [Marinobacterium sp. xm-a-121]NRP46613.1 Phosphate-binding protein PstS precursor [Marinobacterium sp. xm-d-543]NRP58181.1 Phosphate-binding protein PstS precursor [Marinobacterium sp. xm-d-51